MLPSNFLLVWPAPCLQHVDVEVPELPMYLIAKKLLISWRLNWTLKFQSLFQIIRIMNWGFYNKGISRAQKAVDAVACSCWYVYLLFLWSGFHLLSLTFFQQEYATIFEQKYGWWLRQSIHMFWTVNLTANQVATLLMYRSTWVFLSYGLQFLLEYDLQFLMYCQRKCIGSMLTDGAADVLWNKPNVTSPFASCQICWDCFSTTNLPYPKSVKRIKDIITKRQNYASEVQIEDRAKGQTRCQIFR